MGAKGVKIKRGRTFPCIHFSKNDVSKVYSKLPYGIRFILGVLHITTNLEVSILIT